jgi:hypothetical protein
MVQSKTIYDLASLRISQGTKEIKCDHLSIQRNKQAKQDIEKQTKVKDIK